MSHSVKNSRLHYGQQAEEFVTQQLQSNGFSILARNYTKRCGEIDIIVKKNEIIACVEVKARATDYFNLSEVITLSKQRKIIKTAQLFVSEHNLYNTVLRFDVALVTPKNNTFDIQYIENAFTKHEY